MAQGTKALKDLLSKEHTFVKYSAKAASGSSRKVGPGSPKIKGGKSPNKSSPGKKSTSSLAKKQHKSPVESTKNVAEDSGSSRRYFIESREGEAVELIKASILSRPSVRRSPHLQGSPDKQRYQINHYLPSEADEVSPLASRLSELSPFPSEKGTPPLLGEDSTELWSPAVAMRNARQQTKTNHDIVPTTKGRRTTKSAKRSLKMLEK